MLPAEERQLLKELDAILAETRQAYEESLQLLEGMIARFQELESRHQAKKKIFDQEALKLASAIDNTLRQRAIASLKTVGV